MATSERLTSILPLTALPVVLVYVLSSACTALHEHLKNYVIARKTFDASLETAVVISEFNSKFYGATAGAVVTRYNKLLSDAMAAAPTVPCVWPPSCAGAFGPADSTAKGGVGYSAFSSIFPSHVVVAAAGLLQHAQSTLKRHHSGNHEPTSGQTSSQQEREYAWRLEEAAVPIQYVLLRRWSELCHYTAAAGVAWPLLPSKRASFDMWAANFNRSYHTIPRQWGEERCDKDCFEALFFSNQTENDDCNATIASWRLATS